MIALPLAVGPTGRYLVGPTGVPTLIHGEAAWSLAAAASRDDASQYLSDRGQRGVNAIIVNLVEYIFAPDAPRNVYGTEPFLTPGRFGTPNPEYFAHIDWLVGEAALHGIVIVACPCYLGYPEPHTSRYNVDCQTEGWYDELLASGVDECRAYGEFLGKRYKDAPNIVWMLGGDRNPGDAFDHICSVAQGLRLAGADQLCTAHVFPECTPADFFSDEPWLDINLTYTYGVIHRQCRRDYARKPIRPTLFIESTYENLDNATQVQMRRQAWWPLLCGASGQFIGTYPTWSFQDDWQSQLGSPASVAMTHLKDFFDSYRWWDLVPDDANDIVVGGVGELRGLDTCCTAITTDRRLAISYMPSAREIEVDLSQFAKDTIRITWFDPIRGERHDGGSVRRTGVRGITPPSDQDWAVVLQSY